jgi:hypothetical protein
MLNDVEEKITSVEQDPLTKQDVIKVRLWSLFFFTLGNNEEPLSDFHEGRPCHRYIANSADKLKLCIINLRMLGPNIRRLHSV